MSTVLQEPSRADRLSGPEEGEYIDYRPISLAAVAAMILSIVALITALVTMEAWLTFIPMFALAIASFAVWRTVAHRDRVSGWALAMFAFGLSAALTGWGLAYGYSRESMRQAQVKEFCDAYLQFVNLKRYNEVHQLYDGRLLHNDRNLNLAELYVNAPEIATDRDSYLRQSPLSFLVASVEAGHQPTYKLRLMYRDFGLRKSEAYRVVYDVVIPSPESGKPPMKMSIAMFVEYFKHEVGLERRWRMSQFMEARPEHLQIGG